MPSASRFRISACSGTGWVGLARSDYIIPVALRFWVLLLCFYSGRAEAGFAGAAAENLVRNGNFEDLAGHYPAGVLVYSSATAAAAASRAGAKSEAAGGEASESNDASTPIRHWDAEIDAPVEVISSLPWKSENSKVRGGESKYLLHLNSRAGPGSVMTKVPVPPSEEPGLYRLSFDMAGNPAGGPQVRSLEVDMNPGECRPKKLRLTVQEGANWQRLNWQTVHLVLEVKKPEAAALTLRFRSLTPGFYGPLVDNVRLVALRKEEDKDEDGVNDELVSRHLDLCSGDEEDDDEKLVGERGESALQMLVERMWMKSETWIRQKFFRRSDW